jgi:poly-gamma-glutamate biosynthesis protein PgsC/CapC
MELEMVFLALVVSLLFAGATGFSPGGLIVPSYLMIFLNQPTRLAGTLIAALLTLLCYRLLSQYVIIFGRRMFVFMVLVGSLWAYVWIQLFPMVHPAALEFRVIGWVVPGLIANNFEKQGILPTTGALVTVTIAAYLVGRLLGLAA